MLPPKDDLPLMDRVPNRRWLPHLDTEGVFKKPMTAPPGNGKPWYKDLPWHERLNHHHTLASARQSAVFVSKRAPKDALEIKLTSTYDHSSELFPESTDTVFQPDTIRNENDLAFACSATGNNHTHLPWRRLKNTREYPRVKVIALGHPLQISGIKENISPFNVKLMNSGHHSPLTNPGYSRQPADGTVFHY